MKTKLYEISNSIQHIMDRWESGSLMEPDVEQELDNLKDEFNAKICSIGLYIKHLSTEIGNIYARIDELNERRVVLEKKKTRLHNYILNHMHNCGIERASNEFVNVSRRTSYKTKILDESKIPFEFKNSKVIYSVDKKWLREELMQGVVIDGVELQKNEYIQIN